MKLLDAEEIDECVLEIDPFGDQMSNAVNRITNGNIFQLVSDRCHYVWDDIFDEIRDRRDEHN